MTTLPPILRSMPLQGDAGASKLDLATPAAAAFDTSGATTYTDLNALAALKRDPNSPQAISAVAEQVEALFLQMMLKSMRDATSALETESNELGMYQDMFDKQVALSISQHADLGIGRLLKRQLAGKSVATAAASAPAALTGSATAAVTGSGTVAHTAADFVARLMPPIRRAASALGVDPMGLLAQAALETGWGQRLPRNADGSPSFNMFGVKAGDEWSGGRATADSMEVSNGVASLKRTVFRAYGSIEESVNDFANLLKNAPRYRDVIAAGGSAQGYIDGIGKSGYATDPQYANKLTQILHSDALKAALGVRVAAL